jgi:hypothetical protein
MSPHKILEFKIRDTVLDSKSFVGFTSVCSVKTAQLSYETSYMKLTICLPHHFSILVALTWTAIVRCTLYSHSSVDAFHAMHRCQNPRIVDQRLETKGTERAACSF